MCNGFNGILFKIMKKSVILFMLFSFFISCEKCEIYSVDGDSINIPISLKGDYVDISTTPLTKGEILNKYYAFEIDSLNITVKKYPYGFVEYDTTYVHYAGGIFTDIKNVGVFLKPGHKYRIRCSIIEDREDKLLVEDGYAFRPFVEHGRVKINNAFVYGGEKMVVCNVNEIYIDGMENNSAPKVNRYYGEVLVDEVNVCSAISINMERKNFGLHFLLTPPKEGVLKVFHTYGSPEFEYILDSESASVDEEYVYALDIVNIHKTLDIKIEWTKADGEIVDLSPGMTRFYNKTMTTIKVDVNDRVGNSDIEIKLDSDMSEAEGIVIK